MRSTDRYSCEIVANNIELEIFQLNKIEYMKKALIAGVIGQNGSYSAEFLLEKSYIAVTNYK